MLLIGNKTIKKVMFTEKPDSNLADKTIKDECM